MSKSKQQSKKEEKSLVDINFYKMPEKLGGDWAFAGYGVITDGFESKKSAIEYAKKYFKIK